ncbi:MAG: hypothetical protein ACFE0O_04935 [Opitutales bacterium]
MLRWALCALVLFGLTGCEENYQVKVDAIHDKRVRLPAGTSYKLIIPPKEAVSGDYDPVASERMIKSALAARGYFPVDSVSAADLVITVEVGRTAGRVSFREREVMTPVSDLYGSDYRRFPGIIPVAMKSQIVPEVVSTKYLTLSARNPQRIDENGKPTEIWNIVVKVEDAGESLGEYLPILTAAAMNHMGENTGEQIEVNLGPESKEVQYVENDPTFDRALTGP